MIKRLVTFSLLATVATLGLVGEAFAETAEEKLVNEQAAIVDLVAKFVEQNPALREEWVDFDKDGLVEALVVLPPAENGISEWHVFGLAKGDARDLLTWSSASIELEETPLQRDADGAPMPDASQILIKADGLTFSRLKFGVEPYADMFFESKIRPRPATADELEMLHQFGYRNARMEMAPVLTADFLSAPGDERIIALNDEFYRDEDSTSPYLILSKDGTLLFEGRSTFHPWIFKDPVHGVQLIEDNGNAFSLIKLEPGTEE